MRTVLVVEDEKMIRQGIAAMIKRCGVPVDEILECNNGMQALDILKARQIDVMFTDIRMPKMNGIELVQKMQDLDRPPLTVAISGYDDFSYAVEMMRQGVREYILKPVERDKLKEIMTKLDEEISHRLEDEEKNKYATDQLIKYLLIDKDASEESLKAFSRKFEVDLKDGYRVVVTSSQCGLLDKSAIVFLPEVEGNKVYIIGNANFGKCKNGEAYIGVSDVYTDVMDLRGAYVQARERRIYSFMESKSMNAEDESSVNEELVEMGRKLASLEQVQLRVQIMGTDRKDELKKEWNRFFVAASRGQIPAEDFIKGMQQFELEFVKIYKRNMPMYLKNPLDFDNLEEYKDEFMGFVFSVQQDILEGIGLNQAESKIREAIKFIEENFASDLNMAVVSNQVSMNYSLFSSEFKNYTGKNFVSYVKELRMEAAKQLLADTDYKVNAIAAKVGYDNEKHFMKSFKALIGVSPTEYRKNIKA